MHSLLCFYIITQLVLLFSGIIVYLAEGNPIPLPTSKYDRAWWKYTKLFLYYFVFWSSKIPWYLGDNYNFRSLFKKDLCE